MAGDDTLDDDGIQHMTTRYLKAIALVTAVTVPWVAVWVTSRVLPVFGIDTLHLEAALSTGGVVFVSGVSILGASFLLAWVAETAEKVAMARCPSTTNRAPKSG